MFQLFGIPRELMYGIYIIFLIVYFMKYIHKIQIFDLIYYMIIIPVISYGLIHYGEYIDSSSNFFAVIILFLPGYLFFRIYDFDKMEKTFIASQKYAMIYLLVYYITTVRNADHYSMDYGYWIAIPIVTFIYIYLNTKKIYYMIPAIIALMTLILAGNRGALLLGILCGIYYYIMLDNNEVNNKKITRVLVIAGVAIFLMITSNLWLTILGQHFRQSRTIQKLVEGDLLKSATRERLYYKVKYLISQNESGYGPLASRKILDAYPYPHSLIYEMQLDFGVVIGTLTSFIILIMGGINLYRYRNSNMRLIVAYIELIGLGSLLVSSSYYYENCVPATIALFLMSMQFSIPPGKDV